MSTRADFFVATALSQVGITEDPPGSNMNPYGAYYGMNGVAWCCLFVRWCAEQAGLPFPETAYVPALEAWARDNGHTVDPADIQAGDVVCLDYSSPAHDGADHVEIALGPVVDGRVHCVGGNTSDGDGGSVGNGGGVFTNWRPVSWIENGTALVLPRSNQIISAPYSEDDYMRACRMNDGQVLLVDGSTFQVMGGDWPQINAALIELGRAGLIPVDATGAPVMTPIGDNAVQALRQVS